MHRLFNFISTFELKVWHRLILIRNCIIMLRLPIVDEKAPSEQNFDDILGVLRQQGPETACVFNCQMGKGRTTTGMVIACLVKGLYRYFSMN